MSDPVELPSFAQDAINLASPRMGTEVISVTNEFFAPRERMLSDAPAVFIADKYDDNGKWMDGWETIRKRTTGHDHCVIRLGVKGVIKGIDIDTSHFTGNYPPAASIEGCLVAGDPDGDAAWETIVPSTSLGPDAHHFVEVANEGVYSHLRLNIYPDGGVARLRVYGEPVRDWTDQDRGEMQELSSVKSGGRIVDFNNAHYGETWSILTEGRGKDMGDGWETRRRREPGNDWIIVQLGAPGIVEKIEVDTAHFKGNYPDRCSVQAAMMTGGTKESIVTQSMFWAQQMGEKKLEADTIHAFSSGDIDALGPVSHVRLNIFPDGGVSRFRVYGKLI